MVRRERNFIECLLWSSVFESVNERGDRMRSMRREKREEGEKGGRGRPCLHPWLRGHKQSYCSDAAETLGIPTVAPLQRGSTAAPSQRGRCSSDREKRGWLCSRCATSSRAACRRAAGVVSVGSEEGEVEASVLGREARKRRGGKVGAALDRTRRGRKETEAALSGLRLLVGGVVRRGSEETERISERGGEETES